MQRYNKLRGKIVELYGNQEQFAKKVGTSRVTVNLKLCGKIGFSQDDILCWAEALGIKSSQYYDYFFENIV